MIKHLILPLILTLLGTSVAFADTPKPIPYYEQQAFLVTKSFNSVLSVAAAEYKEGLLKVDEAQAVGEILSNAARELQQSATEYGAGQTEEALKDLQDAEDLVGSTLPYLIQGLERAQQQQSAPQKTIVRETL